MRDPGEAYNSLTMHQINKSKIKLFGKSRTPNIDTDSKRLIEFIKPKHFPRKLFEDMLQGRRSLVDAETNEPVQLATNMYTAMATPLAPFVDVEDPRKESEKTTPPWMVPIVNVRLGTRTFKLLVDTGSTGSLVTKSMLQLQHRTFAIPKFKIGGLGGGVSQPIAALSTNLELLDQKLNTKFTGPFIACVFDELSTKGFDGILGMDFLLHHGFSVDLQKGQLTKDGEKICSLENLPTSARTFLAFL